MYSASDSAVRWVPKPSTYGVSGCIEGEIASSEDQWSDLHNKDCMFGDNWALKLSL